MTGDYPPTPKFPVSHMFDYITGKAEGTEAELKASLEHALGHLGTEIEDNARLRTALEVIERATWREGPATEKQIIAIRKIASAALKD